MTVPIAVERYESNLSATHVESMMKEFSDAGSTPAASTKLLESEHTNNNQTLFCFLYFQIHQLIHCHHNYINL